uniref:EF-hand domain-containing protein n=1 Tax=Timema monikensis TaxID=170555 RepID=A0A7R9EG48_9NEOP|nr:unnamed protein product [Timema monikensis]
MLRISCDPSGTLCRIGPLLYESLEERRSEFDGSSQVFLIGDQVPDHDITLRTAVSKVAIRTGQGLPELQQFCFTIPRLPELQQFCFTIPRLPELQQFCFTIPRLPELQQFCFTIPRKLTPIICALGKGTYQAGGMNITVKGRQVTRKEAPILVVAPHSTFLDASITYVTGFPSIIVRRESGLNPFIGKLINYTQPVYVWREDPNSRQNTIKEIIERVNSDLDWPQVLIFPEGTCTNRSCLITFKPGAFYPGVPVQPVCIRYPNKLDTVTWTWEGPGALKLLWLTLTQVQSSCEIEFLPVYTPSTAEKEDPKLYANNVRQLMAKALGIPVSDYTYDDCRLMTRAKQMNLPCAPCLVEVHRLRTKLGLTQKTVEEDLSKTPQLATICKGGISYQQFAHILGVCPKEEALQHLFKIYDKEFNNSIDFREYLLGVLAISRVSNASEMLQLAFEETFNLSLLPCISVSVPEQSATMSSFSTGVPLFGCTAMRYQVEDDVLHDQVAAATPLRFLDLPQETR